MQSVLPPLRSRREDLSGNLRKDRIAREEATVGSTPKDKKLADAERMRRKAFSRWENEGGAVPCGSQVPGVEKDCADDEEEDGRK
jgi:hypothetical protein